MDLIASQVMHRNVKSVPPEMSLLELERTFIEARVSGFPVVDGDQVVGVVSRSDIVWLLYSEHDAAERTSDFYRDADGFHELPLETTKQVADRLGQQLEQLTVRDVMHHGIVAVPPEQPLRAIAQTLADQLIHRVLVTRDGQLLGVISALDFVRLYANGRLRPG